MSGRVLSGDQQAKWILFLESTVLCSQKSLETPLVEHDMLTGAHRPIASSPYTIPEKWKDPVQKELEDVLYQGIIVPSTSPWASPVVPVQKPDGTVRLCIDY